VARALIVGCGCHGRELGAELLARGWQVRGTSRGSGEAAVAEVGLEAAVADPDRPGTVLELCGDVAVVVWLLGSATGDAELVAGIHGSRLERLLEKLVDTPVRGFVHESAGSAPAEVLAAGRAAVEEAAARWSIPVAAIEAERGAAGWAEQAADAVEGVLARP
jgi:nucleoside-diphosphate-sugar epimerase